MQLGLTMQPGLAMQMGLVMQLGLVMQPGSVTHLGMAMQWCWRHNWGSNGAAMQLGQQSSQGW